MYSIEQLIKGLRNPRIGVLELHTLIRRRVLGDTGIDIMDADWDNLIILDACRFDLFEAVSDLPGELRKVTSGGTKTGQFFAANFADETFPDTVYVSANPQFTFHDLGGSFHENVQVWEDEWDDDLGTVRPQVVAERALDVERRYPDKRLIVHFVQPHYPFLGKTGRRLSHDGLVRDGPGLDDDFVSIWDRLEHGELSEETVWRAYRENLELVLPHVERLLDNFRGKTVVTSDHGNAMGEWGIYGHSSNHYIDALVKVPWLEAPTDERKDVVAGELNTSETRDDQTVSDRLADLGYK